jgi:signal peptidase complex subunit 2
MRRIAIAVYSHFGVGKFPGSWWPLLACVALYIVLSLAMNLYSARVEGDAFLVTRPFQVSGAASATP